MTENKKKTTKRRLLKSESPVKEVKRTRTREKIEKQDVANRSIAFDEVVTVVSEETSCSQMKAPEAVKS